LADFGLSKALTGNNKTKKTLAIGLSERYAAPEQLVSSAISTKCDIWALGLIIYEIIT
jgi:serine/threonine-protein kinase